MLTGTTTPADAVLHEIEERVLWLSMLMIHHANRVRPKNDDLKVGGHQASSASVVSLMTFLFFDFMRRGDRISVKPHASPVLHAINYLMGRLDAGYLTSLRSHHGLQAYPSRTKDPDPVDFSTGSMGLGAVAPNYAALAERYIRARFGDGPSRRYLSLVGDGELDEGSIWETVAEPILSGLDNVIWVVDLNRQSLDRIVPGIRVRQLEEMFKANGWRVLEAKYGKRLLEASAASHGRLTALIDDMSNEEYQFLLRAPSDAIRARFGDALPADATDEEARSLIGDLGGHDFAVLRETFRMADHSDRPTVVFAYTVKGWGLPIAGDPLNHQALLTKAQIDELRSRLSISGNEDWSAFSAGSEAEALCRRRRRELARSPAAAAPLPEIPVDLGRIYTGQQSTQQTFGLLLTVMARDVPALADRIVTVSPDVAISTNLGGWINKVGVWESDDHPDRFAELGPRLISWRRHPRGQHIELGISETNLMLALGQLGLSHETTGRPVYPIGTLYDPFVIRGLEALMYGVYGGGRFVVVGTPSGISLAPEGGAHQSVITPLVGLGVPGLTYWEPCFARELEWILLEALRRLHQQDAQEAAYLRLSTVPIDQALFAPGSDIERIRAEALAGCYRLAHRLADAGSVEWEKSVQIWACGVMVPEALKASDALASIGISADVINCVSPDLVYRRWQRLAQSGAPLAEIPHGTGPVVTVIDGHPAALAWIGSMLGVPCWPLGVTEFGESGTRQDLYQQHHIDWKAIVSTCERAVTATHSR